MISWRMIAFGDTGSGLSRPGQAGRSPDQIDGWNVSAYLFRMMMDESHFTWAQIFMRLLSALAAGAAIGVDREWRRKTAGLKTHMLFALACAAMSVMAIDIYQSELDVGRGGNADATRVLQGIITGMSFLGAGTIIHGQHRIHGLTTGAGVWLAGALGIVFGVGLYKLGVLALGFGMFTLIAIRLIEPRDIKRRRLRQEREAELAGGIEPSIDNTDN